MSTVAEIFAAIKELSLEQRCELEALLHPYDDDAWDEQMKRDVIAGKFDEIDRVAESEHSAGRTIPLADIIRKS